MSNSSISRNQAVHRLLASVAPLEAVPASPFDAIGRVVSHDVSAFCNVPEYPCSVRDGYALRAGDVAKAAPMNPVRLTVTQAVHAESKTSEPVNPGEAARVLTGGLVPPCADTVLADEDVEIDGKTLIVRKPAREGWFIRSAGGEITMDAIITETGKTVTPQAAAVMIRTRVSSVMVHPAPRVRVLSLGSELSDPICCGEGCDTARFPADNLVLTRGLCEQSGATVTESGVLPDNENALIEILSDANLPDIVITTGGTGGSERDFARAGAEKSGFTTIFDSLAIRPGRNMFAARRGDTLLFGLPGPPTGVFACFHAVILPIIRRLRGLPDRTEPVMARFDKGIAAKPGSEWLVQCSLEFRGSAIIATPLLGPETPSMLGMAKAHGLAVIQSGDAILPGGETEILSTLFS